MSELLLGFITQTADFAIIQILWQQTVFDFFQAGDLLPLLLDVALVFDLDFNLLGFLWRQGWITQTQADAIRSGTSPVDPDSEDMRQAIQIYEGVVE